MDEENKINEGVVEEYATKDVQVVEKKRKTDLYVELFLFFILGALLGITLKTEASKRVTIGYNDYQMDVHLQDYDINKLQVDLAKKSAEEENANSQDNQASEGQNQSSDSTESLEQNSQNQ